jgi:hypothetical protein
LTRALRISRQKPWHQAKRAQNRRAIASDRGFAAQSMSRAPRGERAASPIRGKTKAVVDHRSTSMMFNDATDWFDALAARRLTSRLPKLGSASVVITACVTTPQ